MKSERNTDRSAFAEAALNLDAQFRDFERLANELDRVDLDSDRGLERGLKIMGELETCREGFAPASQQMAKALEEAQGQVARAAEIVTQRETAVQDRRAVVDSLLERYRSLGEMLRQVSTAVGQLNKTDSGELTADQRTALTSRLPEFNSHLGTLVDEARKLMDDARVANMKALERNADSLRQSLHSARFRFGQFAEPKSDAQGAPTTH